MVIDKYFCQCLALYAGEVKETVNNTFITTVWATDKDDGDNGIVVYSIVQGDDGKEFRVNKNGEIYTSEELDREKKSSYFLTVQANDQGHPSQSSTAFVNITVTDVNDESPNFTLSKYKVPVSEGSLIGTTVLMLSAMDKDLGANANVTYSFADPQSVNVTSFSIDAVNGSITTSKLLDAEAVKEYTFDVRATDNGHPSLSSDATVVVSVKDVNDNEPVFNQVSYTANLHDNESPGTSVVTVFATDNDTGDNANVVYSITDNKNFDINPTSVRIVQSNSDLICLVFRE